MLIIGRIEPDFEIILLESFRILHVSIQDQKRRRVRENPPKPIFKIIFLAYYAFISEIL